MNFRQSDERNLSGEARIMKWNPRMDLMAMSMKSNEVALHRLANWQRVWALPPMFMYDTKIVYSSEPQEFKTKEVVKVTDIEWRPDGKVLAISYDRDILDLKIKSNTEAKSSVALIDVENAEVIHIIVLKNSIARTLSWSLKTMTPEEKQSHDYMMPAYIDFLPKLKSLNKPYPNRSTPSFAMRKLSEGNLSDLMKVATHEDLSILTVGTSDGHVYLYALGLLRIGSVKLPGNLNVCHVALSDDFTVINVMAETPSDQKEPSECFSLFSYQISHLNKKDGQFLLVAKIYAQIVSLLRYMSETMMAIKETWEDIRVELDSKLSHCMHRHNSLSDANSNPDPNTLLSDEFMELLVFGTPSEPMDKFLQDMTVKGLNKIGKSIELTYSNIQKLIVINLQRVTQHIMCHINTLKGICLWDIEFGHVGLDMKNVNDSIRSVGGTLMKSIELQQVIDISMRNVKAFFRWLYTVMARLYSESPPPPSELSRISQQDLQFVAEFIEENFASVDEDDDETTAGQTQLPQGVDKVRSTHSRSNFTLERVGQYFEDENLAHRNTSMNNFDLNPWINYLKERPHFPKATPPTTHAEDVFCLFPHNQETSLVQEFANLELVAKNTFNGVEKMFENKYLQTYQLIEATVLPLNRTPRLQEPKIVHKTAQDGLLLALVDRQLPSTCLYILKSPFDGSRKLQGSAGHFSVGLDLSDEETLVSDSTTVVPLQVMDFDFYNGETISVLLWEGFSNISYIAQVPVTCIMERKMQIEHSFRPPFILSQSCARVDVRLSQNATTESAGSGMYYKRIDGFRPLYVSVSGTRKIACTATARRVRIYETDANEDDEDEEMDKSLHEHEQSTLDSDVLQESVV